MVLDATYKIYFVKRRSGCLGGTKTEQCLNTYEVVVFTVSLNWITVGEFQEYTEPWSSHPVIQILVLPSDCEMFETSGSKKIQNVL